MNKQDRLNKAYSELLEIKARIAKSDEHALKCAKLGLSFSTLYKDEAEDYQLAVKQYNDKELEIRAIEAEEDDVQPMDLSEYEDID